MDLKDSVTQVWKKIEAVTGPLDDEERSDFLGLVLEHIEGQCRLETIIETIVTMRRRRRQRPNMEDILKSTPPESRVKGITRTKVLAEIVATHANEEPEVVQFREEVLEGTLLQVHEIQPWITQEQEKERKRPAIFLDAVPLPVGHDIRDGVHGGIVPDPPLSVGEEHPAGGLRFEVLHYQTPDKAWVRRVPVAHGGVLARLHHLSITLAQRYRWQLAQATAFVLTGLPPVLPAIDATWDSSFFQTQAGGVTAFSRLVLTIDPTLSPKEVHNYFQAIRQRILGPKWRDLNESQLELARFALHRAQEESWQQCMAAWNTEFQRWSYGDDLGHFRRDCLHAIQKLITPALMAHNFFPQSEENDAETPRES
jgi:hypothetical protein